MGVSARSIAAAMFGATLLLTGCATGANEELEEFLDEAIEISDPINALCTVLDAQASTDPELPPLLLCEEQLDTESSKQTLLTVWGDPAKNAVENNIDSDDWPIAAVIATAKLYALDQDRLGNIGLIAVGFEDECRNVFEMQPNTAVKLAEPGADTLTVLEEADLYSLSC